MSLSITLTAIRETEVHWGNITHNLNKMAMAAGIYELLWRPEEINITHAGQVIEPLKAGLRLLESDPERFSKYNAPNGWGIYEDFLEFVRQYLFACEENPDATISICR